ncbi:sensor histidine kinase [Fibrivirga algicola]|uniref:histidine kinase n=1 Tax=Fibrivirga algicola TaxID=2950420 RepID=A0ABX0QPP7_9BACT|nr:ATP-binding protein [Fibrivirga algicola]NID12937.1 two-component sensor histidine kinase [Fibrivirga algicola]
MKLLSGSGLCLFFLLTASLIGWAQSVPDDSVGAGRSQAARKETYRLRAALSRPVGSVVVADSLLTLSRQIAYPSGQVIALCQLAGLQLEQQPQQAAANLQEANRLVAQLTDYREAGWVLGQVVRIQTNAVRTSPTQAAAFAPVMEALGKAIGRTVVVRSRPQQVLNAPFVFEPNTVFDKRVFDRRTAPERPTDPMPPSVSLNGDPARSRYVRVKTDFVDRLLDTLILFEKSSPQVVKQLTARKKLRDSNEALSTAFAKEGDYAQAYRYYLQYTAYKDSLTAEATSRRLASLTYKQSLLKKESQIQLLTKDRQLREQESNRQRQYVLLLIGCIALLIGFAFVLSRNNRAKHLANQQLSEQKEALQATLAQLKLTQTQLIQAEKMASLGELTAGIAHEIQNPLNFVNNFSEVSTELVNELIETRQQPQRDVELEEELLSDMQQNLRKITEHGNRASSIIKGMLEHARTTGVQKERTDLNALTEEYTKLAYHSIRAKDKSVNAKLTIESAPDLGDVSVVPQEVGRVILNIVNNAFYAVQKRQQQREAGYTPEVLVRTERKSDQICITIRDNGIGIPPAIKQKIFQPFFTTKPAGQGTGLGLSLSYDIITKGHGGTLTVDSEEGQFTEFVLTLPASV